MGPAGRVTGVDISPDLAALARLRTRALANVAIVQADAALHRFQSGSQDALFSRHGCMFFTDPAAAFTNIHHGLRPGARVAMSAFTALAENPWTTVPLRAVDAILGPQPPAGPQPPGPFAWAEPSVFEAALAAAGFRAIGCEVRDLIFTLGAGDHPDPVERACDLVLNIGVVARRLTIAGDDAATAVRPALREALAPHVVDGWVRLGARIWLISALA